MNLVLFLLAILPSVLALLVLVLIEIYQEHLHKINLKCLLGNHDYVYAGQSHGMMINKDTRDLVGTQRNVYKCIRCEKDKPVEDNDYE